MTEREAQYGRYRLFSSIIQLPLRWRLVVVALGFGAYAVAALLLFEKWGVGMAAWGGLGVVLSGALFGVWGGLIGGLFLFPLNILLLVLLGGEELRLIFAVGGLGGHLMAVAIGGAVGWLQTVAARLEEELTQRQAVELALRASEEQHRQMFANNQAIKLLIDPVDGRIVDANPAAVEFYGHSLPQLQLMKISDINTLPPEEVTQEMRRALQAERSYFLFRHRLASGELRHVEVYSSPVRMGERMLLYSIIHDITERVEAEKALSESERQYRSLIQQSNDAIYLIVDGRFEMINAQFSQIFGVSVEEAREPGFNWMDLVAPESVPLIEERIRKVAAGEILPGRYEFMAIASDGRRIPVEASVSYIKYRGEIATQGILRDITERYEAQETLRQSEEYFRALIENALDIITVVNANGTIRYKSPSIERILGYKPEEMMGRNVLDFIHPDDLRRSVRIFLRKVRNPQNTETLEFRVRNKAGEWRIIEATGRILLDSPVVKGIVVNSRDVTERRLTEKALRLRAAELEALAEISAELRLADNVADIVPTILKRTNFLGSDIVSAIFLTEPKTGDLVARGWHPEETQWVEWRQPDHRGIAGHVIRTGEMYITANLLNDPLSSIYLKKEMGALRNVYSNIFLPLQAQQRVIGVLHIGLRQDRQFTTEEIRLLTAVAEITGSAIDRALVLETLEQRVSERTQALAQANERLQQLDHLKSKFVSDVSHELRTPVANLNLYLDLLERGRSDKRNSYMAVLREQTDRLTQLIEDILDLARLELNQKNMPWLPIDLNDLIYQALTAHALRAEALGLKLQFTPQDNLPLMRGDPNQILQVITNLITNALNYTPTGEICLQSCYNEKLNRLCLQVQDSGLGIDADDLPHLFERFYRGKWVSQSAIPGTGLGLAIVKEIIDSHHGEIEVISEPGQGATFRVWWPAVTAAGAGQESAVPQEAFNGRN
jgi:PAS domain S-box-containing protein